MVRTPARDLTRDPTSAELASVLLEAASGDRARFDHLATLARLACQVPLALIRVATADGLPVLGRSDGTGPDAALVPASAELPDLTCSFVVRAGSPVLIRDGAFDDRLDLPARAYLGVPLLTSAGEVIGSVCALSFEPRDWIADEVTALIGIAEAVVAEAERRLSLASLSATTLSSIVAGALDAVVICDRDGQIREFNRAAESLFGYSRTRAVTALRIEHLVPAHLRAAHAAGFRRFFTGTGRTLPTVRRRTEGLRADGSLVPVELTLTTATRHPHADGDILVVAHLRDLTDDLARERELVRVSAAQQEADSAVAVMRQRLDAVLESAPTILFAIDLDERFSFATGAGLAALGLSPGDLRGRRIAEVYGRRSPVLPCLRRALAGEEVTDVSEIKGRVFRTTCRPMVDPEGLLVGTVGVANDITVDQERQQELHRLATVDPLTGLMNRRAGEAAVAELLDEGVPLFLLLVDLDHFKDINDSLGHAVGDRVLARVAGRLSEQLPEQGVLARLGGDELLIALPAHHAPDASDGVAGTEAPVDAAHRLAGRLLGSVAEPIELELPARDGEPAGSVELAVTGSIGIARTPRDGLDLSTLLARADAAMFGVKRSGRSGFADFVPQVDTARRRLSVSTRLRRAVRAGRIDVHYQPLVRLVDGRTTAFEALARWTDPDLGPVSPVEFVGLAEESGLMGDLTDLVVDRALAAAARWNADHPSASDGLGRLGSDGVLRIGVNLAVSQLADAGLPRRLADAVAAAGLPPDGLVLELIESAAIGDGGGGLDGLRGLRDVGIAVVVDDFGVGYSSLARLRDLSAENLLGAVKLDRSFVADLPSPRASTLVQAFVRAAAALGLPTVAEGIETEEQLAAVQRLGCDVGQGWLWAKAMPDSEVAGWLQRSGAIDLSTP